MPAWLSTPLDGAMPMALAIAFATASCLGFIVLIERALARHRAPGRASPPRRMR